MFNFMPADEPKKLEVRRYMDAGKGTKLVRRKAPPKPLYKSKPRAKKVTAPKPVKTKTQVKKVVTKKPIVSKKKPVVSKKKAIVSKKKAVVSKKKAVVSKKPVVSKKKAIVSKKKPVVSKKKPVVSKKPLVTKKPMVRAKPVMRPKPVRRAAPRRTRPASINTGMSLQQTADLGYYATIAGGFLLSSAILPGIADVALEAIGILYTLYFTYNYCLFEESRDEFKNTLAKIESNTGLDIPAFFDFFVGAATSVTDKINIQQSTPKVYPKKKVVDEEEATEVTEEEAEV